MMSSIKSIMDLEVGHVESSSCAIQKDKDSSATLPGSRAPDLPTAHPTSASTHAQQEKATLAQASTPTTLTAIGSPTSEETPGSVVALSTASASAGTTTALEEGVASSSPLGKRRVVPSSRASKSSQGAAAVSPSSSSKTTASRRRSTASADSMDQHGYASSSAMGTGGGTRRGGSGGVGGLAAGAGGGPAGLGGAMNSNMPRRPMGHHIPPDLPLRYTPITGRVSRAKKGMPVHTCETCKPPKTFTRAEHLRRHQLSHEKPAYHCRYPGCDRTFHRQDLLVRHQQKHEPEEDKGTTASPRGGRRGASGDEDTIATSTAEGISIRLQPSLRNFSATPGSGSGVGASTPASSSDVPSTPNVSSNNMTLRLGSVRSSPGEVPNGLGGSPHRGHRRPSYDAPLPSYVLSQSPLPYETQSVTLESPTLRTPTASYQPRTQPPLQLYPIQTDLPDLSHPTLRIPALPSLDHSPWSSEDSSYSTTPASEPSWFPRHVSEGNGWLDPYSAAVTSAAEVGPIGSMAISHSIFVNPYSSSPHQLHPTSHHYNPYDMTDVPQMGPFGPDNASHALQQVLGSDPVSATLHGPDPGNSISLSSSVRSPSPITTSSHIAEALVAPSTASPADQVALMAGLDRRKAMMVDGTPMEMDARARGSIGGGNAAMLGAASAAGQAGHDDDNSRHGGYLAVLASVGMGECGSAASAIVRIATPLGRALRNAIPGYLERYWNYFHDVYPVVHRPSFDAAPGDALRFAMAAIGTQFLDGKEDRAKGSQLYDHAMQEIRRCASWDLQTNQAILLCEYFARFRGKKAIARPSRLFESLYARVSCLQFLDQSDDSFFCRGTSALSSSHASSSASASSHSSWYSCSSATPTSLSNLRPHLGYGEHLMFPVSSSSACSSSFSGQLHAPPVTTGPVSTATALAAAGHQYLDHLQVLEQFQSVFGQTLKAQDNNAHLGKAQRWQIWVEMEAHRRLLNACFFLDVHTSVYHEQSRTRDPDAFSPRRNVPPIPLVGHSAALWAAKSADEWAALLDTDPSAGQLHPLPKPESLQPMGSECNIRDRLAILARETLQLPRRIVPTCRRPNSFSAPGPSSRPDIATHNSQAQDNWDEASVSMHVPGPSMDPAELDNLVLATGAGASMSSFETESRISQLFPGCPVANTYLALHHTPLHDLMAVSGNSWVFSKKELQPSVYAEHKKQLRHWVEQLGQNGNRGQAPGAVLYKSVTRAVVYSARALVKFLETSPPPSLQTTTTTGTADPLSGYWGMYVCALICWAFGYRPSAAGANRSRAASGGQGNINITSPRTTASVGTRPTDMGDEVPLSWLRCVAGLGIEETPLVCSRSETIGVVGLVRRRLEADCIGGKSQQLFADAVSVLRKLEEGVNWSWF